ncbi:MAG: hypothetical protein HC913_07655 [Microscillaceae bacterium]|nr:hypothetical protein [Microscillaceae bacterium]
MKNVYTKAFSKETKKGSVKKYAQYADYKKRESQQSQKCRKYFINKKPKRVDKRECDGVHSVNLLINAFMRPEAQK